MYFRFYAAFCVLYSVLFCLLALPLTVFNIKCDDDVVKRTASNSTEHWAETPTATEAVAQQQRQHKIEHSNALPLSLLCSLVQFSLSPCLFTCCGCACVGAAAPCRPLCVCARTFVWLSKCEREKERAHVHSLKCIFFLLCLGKNESKAGQITKKRRICCASHAARFYFGLRAALFISSGGASTAQPIVCRCIGMRVRRSRSRRRRCVCFCV